MKRKIISMLLIVTLMMNMLVALTGCGNKEQSKQKESQEDSINNEEANDNTTVENEKVTKVGDLTLEFDGGSGFYEGLAVIEKDGKYGYIDTEGNLITDLQYNQAYPFSDGLARIVEEEKVEEKVDVENTSNNTSKLDIKPMQTTYLYTTKYIDINDNLIIELESIDQKELTVPLNSGEFSEGLALVCQDGKYGYIDTKGNAVIDYKYGGGRKFSEGLAPVEYNGEIEFIDKEGNVIIKLGEKSEYKGVSNFSEGLAAVCKNGKCGYIDTKGNVVIDYKYDSVSDFSEGLALVKKGEKYGYINYDGTVIIGNI